MANWNDPQLDRSGFGASPSLNGAAIGRATYDQGLRRHMLSIYNYMTSGVLLSGIIALLFAMSGMGFLGANDAEEQVRVTATDAWLRIDARFGAVVRRRHALLPLLV